MFDRKRDKKTQWRVLGRKITEYACLNPLIVRCSLFIHYLLYLKLLLFGGVYSLILVMFILSPLGQSLFTADSFTDKIIPHSTRQDYIIYYLYSYYLLSRLFTYQPWTF